MQKLIITAAITGAEHSKTTCPALPISAEEQGEAAAACVEAGASIIHLHVRNDAGEPSQNIDHFKRSVEAIYSKCRVKPIIQFSTGGALRESMERRIEPLKLKPDMGSFNLGTMNFGEEIFVNSFSDMRNLGISFKKFGVVPEFEIYDAGHTDNLKKLVKEGIVKPPFHCQFVLGVPGALTSSIQSLNFLISNLPEESTWSVAGIGQAQLSLAVHGLLMGGHVRVGLEDNIFFAKYQAAKSNAELVARIVRIANEVGRDVASPDEARESLGVTQTSHLSAV